ncbi:MAG: undecaprenyl-diphosphate phosphatase [Candidatus Bipolaricaulota bacterium]|nr:MAG: undecaprenyl-diphosphate phosphatase [Candidatus Bipolaricaulota bacterium]
MSDVLLLALVQGITEFLPISSSGHLAIGGRLLAVELPGVLVQAALHLGTAVSVLIVFRREVWALVRALLPGGSADGRRTLLWLAVATVPIAVLGFTLGSRIEALYSSLTAVGTSLLATGILLTLSDFAARRSTGTVTEPRGWRAVVGVAQAAALLPGLSRSGATIASARLLGVDGMAAARFSFLLSLPAVLGAAGAKLWTGLGDPSTGVGAHAAGSLALGAVVACVVGIAALKMLLAVVARSRLGVFGGYCLALGASVIAWELLA